MDPSHVSLTAAHVWAGSALKHCASPFILALPLSTFLPGKWGHAKCSRAMCSLVVLVRSYTCGSCTPCTCSERLWDWQDALVIGSRLDADAGAQLCRLALAGRLVALIEPNPSQLARLRLYKVAHAGCAGAAPCPEHGLQVSRLLWDTRAKSNLGSHCLSCFRSPPQVVQHALL